MSKHEESMIGFLAGALTGIISGLVCGLIFAPKPGIEMRKDISGRAKDLQNYTKEKLTNIRQAGAGTAKEVTSGIHERANKISLKLDELARRGTDVLIQDEVQ